MAILQLKIETLKTKKILYSRNKTLNNLAKNCIALGTNIAVIIEKNFI